MCRECTESGFCIAPERSLAEMGWECILRAEAEGSDGVQEDGQGLLTLWPVNKKFQWTGQGLKFLKKFRFGLEWPPAASGPQTSTMNRIFGRIFPSFIKIHCNRTIFEEFSVRGDPTEWRYC